MSQVNEQWLEIEASEEVLKELSILSEHSTNLTSGFLDEACLHGAASTGDLSTVHNLLTKGVDPDVSDSTGKTALMGAAGNGNLSIVHKLLVMGAGVDVKDHDGNTALAYAIDGDSLPVVKVLVAAGANPNARFQVSWSVLGAAINRDQTEIAKVLIDAEANLEALDSFELHRCADNTDSEEEIGHAINVSMTPLEMAISKGHCDLATVLMQRGSNINRLIELWNESGQLRINVLIMAVLQNLIDSVKFCLDHGADINARDSDGETALNYADVKGYTEIAELLIDHGAEFGEEEEVQDEPQPEEDHDTQLAAEAQAWQTLLDDGLSEAANTSNLEKMRESLELGASPQRPDLLHNAVTSENLDIVALLLEAGCFPDTTAVEIALKSKRYDMIDLLTAKGANVDSTTSNGRTALMTAARKGDHQQVQQLLHSGADANAVDSDGMTPLMLASKKGHLTVVCHLLKAHASVDEQDLAVGATALIFASQEGYESVVKKLLTAKADPNIQTFKGATALLLAAERGYAKVVSLLISKGADVEIKDSKGNSALSIARKRGRKDVVALLSQRIQ